MNLRRLSRRGIETDKTSIVFTRDVDEAAVNTELRIADTIAPPLYIHKDLDGNVDATCLGIRPCREWWKGGADGDIRLDRM